MAVAELDITNFDDGNLIAIANKMLVENGKDVYDRPYIKDARTVTVKLSISPEIDPATGSVSPVLTYSCGKALPGFKQQPIRGFFQDGRILINTTEAPPQQRALFEGEQPGNVATLATGRNGTDE